jgi:hypothetical protein
MTFDDFRNNHPTGSRVGDDSLVASGEETERTKYQCVSLVKAYIRECYNLEPGAWGNAIHYWTRTAQPLLTKFQQVSNSEAQKGDIVILWGVNNNPLGHIGIATGGLTATTVDILEQNGSTGGGTGTGQDAIRTRWVARSRVAGLLRPVAVAQPVATPSSYMSYTPASGVKRANKIITNWWNLNNPTADINNFRIANTLTLHTPFPIGGYAVNRNFPQYRYAMTPEDYQRAVSGDYSTNNGINEADLEDIPVPPYVPPAAPEPVKLAERYTVITRLMAFSNADDARGHQNVQRDIEPGEYYVFSKVDKCYNLTDSNVHDRGWWINTADNVIQEPPVPTLPVDPPKQPDFEPVDNPPAIEPAFKYFFINADKQPRLYRSVGGNNEEAIELDNRHAPLPLKSDWKGYCTYFAMVDGHPYYISDKLLEQYHFGIAKHLIKEVVEEPEQPKPVPARVSSFDVNRDNKVNWDDFIDFGSKLIDRTRTTIAPLAPKITEAKIRAVKTMDGFVRRSTKK